MEPSGVADAPMHWKMEANKEGDLFFEMSCDIAIAIKPLPVGTKAEPYVYIPPYPLDPNAPKVDDDFEFEIED